MGNLLAVVVHAANIHDTKSGILAVREAFANYPSIQRLCADAGYRKTFEQNEHIINLRLEVRGNLRTDKAQMLSVIERYLQLPPDEKLLFTIGRRLNIFYLLDDLRQHRTNQMQTVWEYDKIRAYPQIIRTQLACIFSAILRCFSLPGDSPSASKRLVWQKI